MISLDARTHLFVLLLTSSLAFLAREFMQTDLLVALCMLYMGINGMKRNALQWGFLYILLRLLCDMLATSHVGAFVVIIYSLVKMVPLTMIGTTLMSNSPSALMCAYTKMHVPKSILVMLCILLRFFPVLKMELYSIRDGIRARGIFSRWYSLLRNPALTYECFFMPLIVRCLKLSTELASSAELRGIECSCDRTSIYPIGFKVVDGIVVGLYALGCVAILGMGGVQLYD